MSDPILSALPEITNPAATDMVYVLHDPAVTQIDNKSQIGNLVPGKIPAGGTTGQALVKNTATNYDTGWLSVLSLMSTVVKTASYTAVAGEYVLFDLTSGSCNLTFPPAPPNGTLVGARISTFVAGNTVTMLASGTDVFLRTGASNQQLGALSVGNQGIIYEYASGVWQPISTVMLLSNFNTVYQQLATLTTKGDLYAASAASTVARVGVAPNGNVLIADSSQTTGLNWGAAPRVFASTAARDAAITAPTAGMTCITTDTGIFWQYFATQGWYTPGRALSHVAFSTAINGIGLGPPPQTLVQTASLIIPAGRKLALIAHCPCDFLSNGGYLAALIDGAVAAAPARFAMASTNSAGTVILSGEITVTVTAGSHTFGMACAAFSGTMNARGDIDGGYFQVRDIGAA